MLGARAVEGTESTPTQVKLRMSGCSALESQRWQPCHIQVTLLPPLKSARSATGFAATGGVCS
jgi:hypothetical protein